MNIYILAIILLIVLFLFLLFYITYKCVNDLVSPRYEKYIFLLIFLVFFLNGDILNNLLFFIIYAILTYLIVKSLIDNYDKKNCLNNLSL